MNVSIVLAVYNRESFIKKCVTSLIQQSFEDYELIIIDDGSVDRTVAILESFIEPKIKLFINDKNKGLMVSRNRGIKESKGKYIAFTDSDCIVDSDWLKELIQPFEKHQSVMITGGRIIDAKPNNYWEFVNNGKNFISTKNDYVAKIIGCNMAFRREFLERNPFDETFKYGADELDLCLHCRREGLQIYYTDAAKVVHHHRSNLKASLKQQFKCSYANTYVNIKHKKFPFINYGSWFLLSSLLAWTLGRLIPLSTLTALSYALLMLYLVLIFYVNFLNKRHNLTHTFLTSPGFLILCFASFFGNIIFIINAALKLRPHKQ